MPMFECFPHPASLGPKAGLWTDHAGDNRPSAQQRSDRRNGNKPGKAMRGVVVFAQNNRPPGCGDHVTFVTNATAGSVFDDVDGFRFNEVPKEP